jgi:hypothetical protein
VSGVKQEIAFIELLNAETLTHELQLRLESAEARRCCLVFPHIRVCLSVYQLSSVCSSGCFLCRWGLARVCLRVSVCRMPCIVWST